MSHESGEWAQDRREAALGHAERLAQVQAQESAHARELIAAFLIRARAVDLPTERLEARSYSGARLRTTMDGWYIRANKSAAIGSDGLYYVLIAEGGMRARLRGAALHPSDPPLVLGASGRDGESIAMREALARILPE